jgi:hypothetical protein
MFKTLILIVAGTVLMLSQAQADDSCFRNAHHDRSARALAPGEDCIWVRIRVWDDDYRQFVWKRVRICR